LHTHWRTVQAAELERRFNPQFSPVKGLNPNQDRYLRLIRERVVTLCLGPAGTGKTWCPAALGAEWLREGKVERVVLTRPLVTCSAGNRDALGILPGEMREKIGPYLRPLLDVFQAKASPAEVEKWIQGGRIDLVPLDVMRGLSFKNSLIIADEMQNSSRAQLHMILTRFAENSKVVVSGDPTQSDLPGDVPPLVDVFHRLGGRPRDVGRVVFTPQDVVRHPLIEWLDRRLGMWDDRECVLDGLDQTWYREDCAHCGVALWYCNGNESDLTAFDEECVKCWQCGAAMVLSEDGDGWGKASPGSPECEMAAHSQRRPPAGSREMDC
jgi:phosphate starvation-inducible protein PhoH